MPGFFICSSNTQVKLKEINPESLVTETIITQGVTALKSSLNKFTKDKVFKETSKYIFVLEGYLLNKHELYKQWKVTDISSLMEIMMLTNGEDFFKQFEGCFAGVIIDKKKNKWIVFTNQIGDAPVFYYVSKNGIAVGSQVTYLISWCKEQGVQLSFCESCAYQMLTFGFVANDETYANEIKRLHGGDYLVWEDGTYWIKNYHRFQKNLNRFAGKSEMEIVDEIDSAFRRAVTLEWEKDEEYGYKHLADLSGGLDSRMNYWVAHEMKQRAITALTYCKKGYLDEIIAKEITNDWNDTLLFKALDDASFMYDIDENTEMLGGLSLYSGITGGKQMLNSLELNIYGIEHTGMVGDIVLGSFYRSKKDIINNYPTGMYSNKYIDRLSTDVLKLTEAYYDYEVYLLYSRGFHGACNTHLLRRNYTEVGSPFLNVNFLQLCIDVPIQLRINHYIYKKWIITKYPSAAKYKWEKTGGLITEKQARTQLRKIIKKGALKALRLLGKENVINSGMNPVDYWISKNNDLRLFLDDYKSVTLECCKKYYSDMLIQDLDSLYNGGNALEKSMALTVLSATKLYFTDNERQEGRKLK